MVEDNDWFAPKRFGYGAGLPIAWQGWAVLLGFVAVLAVAGALLVPRHPALFAIVAIVMTVPLTVISAQHTRGGWKWRWGGKE